ncbi:hypothetical protein BOX15_Mlig029518g1 [Macrostomum lignano]|uniref:Fido domain-containing protein n=1 Tax=Macrostomum lignano TaxID=282301 RepID=A0A267F2I3_9PLAT|nr:hypothetical protein BOX15_Mlig029518g1 [Macrostomum lignano]
MENMEEGITDNPYFSNESVRARLPLIERLLSDTRKRIEGLTAKERLEFTYLARLAFVTEVNIEEREVALTWEEAEEAIKTGSCMVTANLWSAAKHLNDTRGLIDTEFVRQVHTRVCRGLLPNAGSYRIKHAKPAGASMYYSAPENIERQLVKLTRDIKEPQILRDAVVTGAYFLEKFLTIHPFSDGNGRTARLLLSKLINRILPEPVSFAYANRDTYLNCLYEARSSNRGLLAAYLLLSIERTVLQWREWLEICSDGSL